MVRYSLSILVVDDMKFSCEFIRRALIKEGYKSIEVVNSAPDALNKIKEQPIDVIIADWLMPEMDGLELTRKIRQLDEERFHYTGILLLTAKDDISSIKKAFEEGVDDYIVKPPNKTELSVRVYAAGRVATMQNDLLDTTRTLQDLFELRCTVDHITGLGRLEGTEQRLNALIQQTHSRGGATCCAILKIVNFDKIKSQHGADVQEQILSSVANRITRLVRPIDLVGHTNQDEFLIAMYYNHSDDARCRNYRRILHDVNHRSYKTTHGFINITCAMAMTITHKESITRNVKEIIQETQDKLSKSVDMGSEEVAS
jgi:phosphoserine phosphatase RsbU/P